MHFTHKIVKAFTQLVPNKLVTKILFIELLA